MFVVSSTKGALFVGSCVVNAVLVGFMDGVVVSDGIVVVPNGVVTGIVGGDVVVVVALVGSCVVNAVLVGFMDTVVVSDGMVVVSNGVVTGVVGGDVVVCIVWDILPCVIRCVKIVVKAAKEKEKSNLMM